MRPSGHLKTQLSFYLHKRKSRAKWTTVFCIGDRALHGARGIYVSPVGELPHVAERESWMRAVSVHGELVLRPASSESPFRRATFSWNEVVSCYALSGLRSLRSRTQAPRTVARPHWVHHLICSLESRHNQPNQMRIGRYPLLSVVLLNLRIHKRNGHKNCKDSFQHDHPP